MTPDVMLAIVGMSNRKNALMKPSSLDVIRWYVIS